MRDLLITAVLRLAIYFAPVLFGLLGAAVAALGVGVYDQAAGTITLSLEAFVIAITAMVTSGGTAIVALIKGWRARKSEVASP